MAETSLLRFSGRFTDWESMGSGAQGSLYRVRDRWKNEVVALKLSEESDDSLRREYLLLSSLCHPCLIESGELVRDAAEVGHILEYVPTIAPNDIWKRGGEKAVTGAVLQALRGLRYLHRNGYVHCDVNPSNILVWSEGDSWRAKIADLGLAASLAEARELGVRGTAGYIAPEVVGGQGATPESDLYSLAVTAIAWIDGKGPWEGLNPKEFLQRINSDPTPPEPKRQISPQLSSLIRTLCNREPEKRNPDTLETEFEVGWGPPILKPGIHGLDKVRNDCRRWLLEGTGPISTIEIRGSLGSGRKTIAGQVANSLVGIGWTSLPTSPLEVTRDWVENVVGKPDPVRLARELLRRYATQNVVVTWGEHLGELETRLYKAFLASRSHDEAIKTAVLRVSGVAADSNSAWLGRVGRLRNLEWSGPDVNALRSIWVDLFASELAEFVPEPPALDETMTPLSLILQRQSDAGNLDVSESTQGLDGITMEAQAVWSLASDSLRNVLALLAWSDSGWTKTSLLSCLPDLEDESSVFIELEKLYVTKITYEKGNALFSIRDWLLKRELRRSAKLTAAAMETVIAGVESDQRVHVSDLGLFRLMLLSDRAPVVYGKQCMEDAREQGAYESVLDLWGIVSASEWLRKEENDYIWKAALESASVLRRFPDKRSILKQLLEWDAYSQVLKQDLAETLIALGEWGEAQGLCQDIMESPESDERFRAWASLTCAETLWQSGEFEAAEAQYQHANSLIGDSMPDLRVQACIGRARQAGQQSELGLAREILEEGVKKLGEQVFSNNALYFHTSAGLVQASESSRKAVKLAKKAVSAAEATGDWPTAVMATNRLSINTREIGDLPQAVRRGMVAETTALALGSERMAAMSACSLGAFLSDQGKPVSALRKANWAIEHGKKLNDRVLQHNGAFLLAQLSAYYNLDRFEEAQSLMNSARARNLRTYVAGTKAIRSMVHLDWIMAYDHLLEATDQAKRNKSYDSLVEFSFLMVDVSRHLGKVSVATEALETGLELAKRQEFNKLLSIGRLLLAVEDSEYEEIETVVSDLWGNQRLIEICFWSLPILENLSRDEILKSQITRKIVGAYKNVTAHYGDDILKRAFLSAPRYQASLKMLSRR